MHRTLPAAAPSTDVHQHLWTEGFLAALARRRSAPLVRRDDRGLVMRVPGEPDSPFGPGAHDPAQRAASLQATGHARALLCMSTPLGVEALPEDEARPLLDAWHDDVLHLGDAFGVWGALPLQGAVPDDVDVLLDRGAAGISLPAAALAGPERLARVGPLLARLQERDAPLLVHPGPAEPGASPQLGAAAWWPALTTYVADMQAAWLAFGAWGRPAHARLRVCFAMLAGLAPLHAERLEQRGGIGGGRLGALDPLLFYDISSYGPRAVAAMASVAGVDQLVTGSDRPVVDPPLRPPLGEPAGRRMSTVNVHRLLHGRSA